MALIKSAVKLIVRQQPAYRYEGPVLTLGVPEIYASLPELQASFQRAGGSSRISHAENATISENSVGRSLEWVAAKTFFASLGLDDVTSIDVPGCEHQPDLIHNLNTPLPDSFLGRFNLLIDPGTSEHVLDMKMCLTNIVRALRPGGVLIQFTPIYSYNGGYFSINPNMLTDFYAANGFEQIDAYIIMWDRYHPYTGKSRCYPYRGVMQRRHALADHDQCRFAPHLLLFARKREDVPEITVPVQDESQSHSPGAGAHLPAGMKGIARAAFELLPTDFRYALKARVDRELMLREARRDSFFV